MTKTLSFIEDFGDDLTEAKKYAEKVNGQIRTSMFGNYEVVFIKQY